MQSAAALPVLDDLNFGRSELGLAGLSKRALLTLYLLHWRTFKRPQYLAFRQARRELWQIKRDYYAGSVDASAYFKLLLIHLAQVTDTTAQLLSVELQSRASVALKLLWRTQRDEPSVKVLMRDRHSRVDREMSQLPNFYPYSANTAFKNIVDEGVSYFASNDLIELFEAGAYENCNQMWQHLYDRTAVSAVPPVTPSRVPISGFLCADSQGGPITSLSVRRTLEMASYHVYTALRLLQTPPLDARVFAASHDRSRLGLGFGWVSMGAMLSEVDAEAQEQFQDVLEHVERAIDIDAPQQGHRLAPPLKTSEVHPAARASDSSRNESFASSVPSEGTDIMQHFEELQENARRGYAIYQQLKDRLEQEHPAEFVVINIATGDFVLGSTSREAYARYSAQFGNAPSWEGRIGERLYAPRRERTLQ